MAQRYLHFTDEKGAEGIIDSGVIWNSSFGPAGATFAVQEGGAWVPDVQMSSMGRAKERDIVLVFTTSYLPDLALPEEVMWHANSVPVNVVDIISAEEAKKLLNDSIPEDNEMELLITPHHPAFNDWGDWTRLPEGLSPWVPGKDNEKYLEARTLWKETKDLDVVVRFWKTGEKPELSLEEEIRKTVQAVLSSIKI